MTARITDNRSPSAARGFSLTELLVVIGIIVLLVGLLLVALGGVRTRAKQADTEGIMRAFSQACESFQMEHRRYPGIIPEATLDQSPGRVTTTECALLDMMGGCRAQRPGASSEEIQAFDDYSGFTKTLGSGASQWKLKIDLNKLGEGPLIDGKPYAPYFTPSGREFSVVRGQWYLSATPDDEQLPDLVDSWGQPILYVRRLRSIGPLVGDPSATSPQFTMAGLYGYLASDELGELGADQVYTAGSNPSGSILSQSAVPLNEGNFARIIEHPALAGQPRGAFALFSAGPDGVYFSATDGPGTPTSPETDLANFPATVIEEFDDVRVFGGG